MKFDIVCTEPTDEDGKFKIRKFVYDNMTSEIWDSEGNLVFEKPEKPKYKEGYGAFALSRENPANKKKIKVLKVQLGLSCNYSCEYCSQRFVPTADETSAKHVEKFIKNLDLWIAEPPKRIEFWGGEPFVYWKTIKPLAEALREKYPSSEFLVITNGSLLTPEINKWIVDTNIMIGISHDGPGQWVRGPDPFDDIETERNIMDLFIKKRGNISFNSMCHRMNMDRAKIAEFFKDRFGEDIRIGEGSFIDTYDEGAMENAKCSIEEFYAFRKITMHELRDGLLNNFMITRNRLDEWLNSFKDFRPAKVLGQKCGMDRWDTIAVDLRGNVLTCQNVSAVSSKDNGQQHLIGHVSNLDNVKLDTATHWSHRDKCKKCPVLQVCKGSCMFLDSDTEKFEISCNSAYSDHIPFFAGAFEMATGCLPFGILAQDGSLPDERVDLWGPADKQFELPQNIPEEKQKWKRVPK
jgi:uncharacterized protein